MQVRCINIKISQKSKMSMIFKIFHFSNFKTFENWVVFLVLRVGLGSREGSESLSRALWLVLALNYGGYGMWEGLRALCSVGFRSTVLINPYH